MTATIAPSEVFAGDSHAEDSGLAENQFYFFLDFPDFQFPARKTKIVIGRGLDTEELDAYNLSKNEFASTDGVDGVLGKRKRSSQALDGSTSGSDDDRKRSRAGKSPSENNSNSSCADMEEVPHHSTRHHLTQVGGIGGPQTGSDDPEEDFVAVHPVIDQDTGEMASHSISRRHLRIVWNEEQGWILEVHGRNGCFVNEHHYTVGMDVVLEDEDKITLKGVAFSFYLATDSELEDNKKDGPPLNGIEGGELSADAKRISEETAVTDESQDEQDEISEEIEEDEEDDDEDDEEEEEDEDEDEDEEEEEEEETEDVEENKAKVKKLITVGKPKPAGKPLKIKLTAIRKGAKDGQKPPKKAERRASSTQQKAEKRDRRTSSQSRSGSQEPVDSIEAPQKRRGPGRPPADGIMSKRERRERQKAAEAGVPYGTALPVKPKPKEKEGEVPTESVASVKKPKKTKREGGEQGEAEDEGGEKDKKTSAEPPPPRPPTPKESDYSPEALQKPEDTYQGLLYTLLSELTEPMALPEIYEAMKNKWPYFRFSKETKGWESSVRHNLQSCKCFEKVQRAGKGWRWVINPEHPFERKSKRTTEPNPAAAYGSRYPPMQAIGANQYGFHVGYPSGTVGQMQFGNGQRLPTVGQHSLQNGQGTPQFGQQPNRPFPQHFTNGQLPNVPTSSMPAPGNYSSPYSTNNASRNLQGQVQQPVVANMQGSVPGQMLNRQSVPMLQGGQSMVHPGVFQQTHPVNGFPAGPQGQMQGHQTPIATPAHLGPPRPIEPPADDEIRAGRTPAVVKRFLMQLRRISGADADKTMNQAQQAIDFIVKHPDGNGTADPEKENGAPASMVDVIRGLIQRQSNDSRMYTAQAVHAAQAAAQASVRPPDPVGGPIGIPQAPAVQATEANTAFRSTSQGETTPLLAPSRHTSLSTPALSVAAQRPPSIPPMNTTMVPKPPTVNQSSQPHHSPATANMNGASTQLSAQPSTASASSIATSTVPLVTGADTSTGKITPDQSKQS